VIRLEEEIAAGQAIERYRLLASDGGAWREVAAGSTIGHARLQRVPSTTARRVRLEVEGIAPPRIGAVRLYSSGAAG
jgi:alpha-L-fucosidase